MNELFKDKLKLVANDSLLLQVLKAVFDEVIEKEMPHAGETDNNVLLGEKWRAYETAIRMLENGFAEIKNYKENHKPEIKFNKER